MFRFNEEELMKLLPAGTEGERSAFYWLGSGESRSSALWGTVVVYLAAVESRRLRLWAVIEARSGLIVDIL
jgi:hypothetical protein